MIIILKKFLKNNVGATAIEYALIAAMISVATIIAVQNVGTSTESVFENLSTTLDNL